jgi:hypothetical protein
MGQASILYYVAAAVGAYSQVQQGRAQAFQYKAEAQQAKMQARDTEIERRQRLLKALAERQAQTAAGGATLEGTPGVLINASEEQSNLDALALEGMTSNRIASLNAAARNARTTANTSAASSFVMALSGGGEMPGSSNQLSKSTIGSGNKTGSIKISSTKNIGKGTISGTTVTKTSGAKISG